MATLRDIGAELGLSPATVSRALNGYPEVNARTRMRVEEAARRMNYRPNQIAKKLVTGRSGMVGMVLKPNPTSAGDASFYEVMFGLSEQLARRDMDLVFHAATDDDPVAPYRRLVQKNTLDGFILNAPVLDDPRIAYLIAENVPFVVHGRAGQAAYPYYDIMNDAAGADAVDLLADLGHRRIALLNGPAHHAYAVERLAGFRRAMAAHGLGVPAHAIFHDSPSDSYGYQAALALLSGRLGRPATALVCASTVTASGAYRAAQDLGLSIPGNVSVVAHDDALPQLRAVNCHPALTVTRAPLRDASEPLAQALCDLLDGVPGAQLQTVARPQMIVRNSTGPTPAQGAAPW